MGLCSELLLRFSYCILLACGDRKIETLGIQTHNRLDVSHLSKPLDQTSIRTKIAKFLNKCINQLEYLLIFWPEFMQDIVQDWYNL